MAEPGAPLQGRTQSNPGIPNWTTLEAACGLEWSACAPADAQDALAPQRREVELEVAEPQVSLERSRAFTQGLKVASARH